MAVEDDSSPGIDAARLEERPHAVAGAVDLVQLDVDGTRNVPLPRVARVPALPRELSRRPDVDERDLAALEQPRQLVPRHEGTSRRNCTSASATSLGRSR